jgi:hypothetical protein
MNVWFDLRKRGSRKWRLVGMKARQKEKREKKADRSHMMTQARIEQATSP